MVHFGAKFEIILKRHIFSDFKTLCCFSQKVNSTLNQIEQRVKKESKWWQCYWGYYVMITFVIVFIGLGILTGHFLNQHVTENRIKTNLDQSSARHLGTVFENYPKCRILTFAILAFSTNFCSFKNDLSGNIV